MCLAVPGKIVSIKNDEAIVDYGTETRKGKLLDKTFKKGDYAIIQGGIVVLKIEKREALAALKLYQKAVQEHQKP